MEKDPLKKKILVVEDDASLRKILAARLKSKGYEVLAAADGSEALKIAAAKHPDVIVLDWTLPGMSGLEILKEIRENFEKPVRGIPVIMLTGRNEDVDRVLGKVVGANFYMTKPYNENALFDKVSELVYR